MLNVIWLAMMCIAVIVSLFTGKMPAVVIAATDSAKFAFTLALGLTGVMTMWLGIMKIAEASGLITLFTRALKPLLTRIFSDVPPDHPAMGVMAMNFAANLLGLSNAATPFGLRAMAELEKLNPAPGRATNAMCTFLSMHSCNLQIVPTTAIALLAATGALHPTDIIVPFLLSSICAFTTAIMCSKLVGRFRKPTPVTQTLQTGEM